MLDSYGFCLGFDEPLPATWANNVGGLLTRQWDGSASPDGLPPLASCDANYDKLFSDAFFHYHSTPRTAAQKKKLGCCAVRAVSRERLSPEHVLTAICASYRSPSGLRNRLSADHDDPMISPKFPSFGFIGLVTHHHLDSSDSDTKTSPSLLSQKCSRGWMSCKSGLTCMQHKNIMATWIPDFTGYCIQENAIQGMGRRAWNSVTAVPGLIGDLWNIMRNKKE